MQQINLYNKNLRKKSVIFSFTHLSYGSLSLLIFLALWQSISHYQVYSLQKKIGLAKTSLNQKQQQLSIFQDSLPKIKKDTGLKLKLAQLEKELISKQTILEILSDQKLGNTHGFTDHFEGLARQTIKGLWLTKLHFIHGGTELSIQGHSKKPELLPKYLQALSSEAAFKGTEFNHFVIQREEKNRSLTFSLNNIRSSSLETPTPLASQ